MMGFEKEFSGKLMGNNFYIKDKIPLMFLNVVFEIHGRIENNRLFALVDTNFGKIKITGERK